MFWKRRDVIAWVLLLLAAVCWVFGQNMLNLLHGSGVSETTAPVTTIHPTTTFPAAEATSPSYDSGDIHLSVDDPQENRQRSDEVAGFILSFLGIGLGFVGVVILHQKTPLLGPDGVTLLPMVIGIIFYVLYFIPNGELQPTTFYAIITFLLLISVRELWGWILTRWNLEWCLIHRLAHRCKTPQLSLMVYTGWIVGIFGGMVFLYSQYHTYIPYASPMVFAGFALVLGLMCLWKYGADLHHFEIQLVHFQKGLPITPKNGAFTEAEQRLLDVQVQHEEAIHTAVTSERFKVDLISNVSHDLRTPLTAILGYSELLQKEVLTAEGQEQLRRLHHKAGYMSDLVDSLFELTKVSSGVIEAKRDEIDLIRLLEQTIGLFDDQMTSAGLVVRRNYSSEGMTVVTDGARLHQVFANLLGNAIKYALTGTRIYLEVKETENSISVRMMNTASYEMDFQPEEIMQRFARGDKSRSTKGSGLGLAIARTYTESVGGVFRVAVDGDQFSAIVELPKTERIL